MQMSDTREIQADPAIVYAALQDPKVLKTCIAGATEVTGTPQDGYTATVVQKVGPVRATFKGHVTMSDMVENRSMKLAGEGKGGAAGFARGDVMYCPSDSQPKARDKSITVDTRGTRNGCQRP